MVNTLISLGVIILVGLGVVIFTTIKLKEVETSIMEDIDKMNTKIEDKTESVEEDFIDKNFENFVKDILPKIKHFVYDYSFFNEDSNSHLFHYKDIYTLVLWQKEDKFEISIHNKDRGAVAASYGIDKELSNKLFFEVFKNLSKFITKIKLEGKKDFSYQQGSLEGYKAGYVAGFLKGQEQYLAKTYRMPTEEEMINDLKNLKEKISK